MPTLATSPLTNLVRVRLAKLGGAFGRAHAQEPGSLDAVSLAAALLAQVLESPELHGWGTAYLPRVAGYRRTIVYLRLLEEQPEQALTDRGIATLQLAAELIRSWYYQTSEQFEHRSQLGDAALLAVAAAPSGILRALGLGLIAAAPEELIEDATAAAKDAAEDAGGFLLDEFPWLLLGVGAFLLLYITQRRG